MPLPRASLTTFLNSAKAALANASQQTSPMTFVVGNEAADLDSLCCAVVLAYLRTYTSTSKSNTLYIPLSNIPRADISLRPELIPVLSHANLKPSDLITLSDLPPINQNSRLAPEKTKWILVDHNSLQGELGKWYGTRLVGCIDHHEEENKVPRDISEEPRIVRKSGSCASLVVEYCKEGWDALAAKSTDNESKAWDAQLASLALGPVLIDTVNLTSESKTTPTDMEAVKYLKGLIKTQEGEELGTEKYFKEISEAKEDIGRLDLPGILRKDYKQWTEGGISLGVSSVVKNLTFLLEKAGGKEMLLTTVKKHAEARDLSICSIMTTSHTDDIFTRELLVWALNEKGVQAAKKFEADSKERLGLEQWKEGTLDFDGDGQWRRCWRQEKTENSRKQVAPLMRTAIDQTA